MTFIAGILTVILVLDCVLLTFLVLIQLPKKDAGIGLAFGGGAADALFGAGSGNALTKITKWTAGIFFVLALCLGLVEENLHQTSTSAFEKALQQKQSQMPAAPAQMPPTTPLPTTTPSNVTTPNPANAQSAPPTATTNK